MPAPGEFSFLNDDGSLDLAGSLDGEPNLPLLNLDDGVLDIGELGKDLSWNSGATGGRRAAEGDQAGDFCCVTSSALRSESELRLFLRGGPVGRKLGCSPIVDKPRLGVAEDKDVDVSSTENDGL